MMHPSVEETAKKIESMEIRGAHRLARSSALALADWSKGDGPLEPGLSEAVKRLIATRPTAVSLRNGIAMTLSGVDPLGDPSEGRARIARQAAGVVKRSEEALGRVASHGAELVPAGATVMTICNSTAAVGVMVRAHQQGKIKMVYALETRPRRQGLITVRELAREGVPVTLIVDSAARHFLPDADIAVVGADTVMADGSVANKIGTCALAAQCREFGVPFHPCAEDYKFHPGSLLGEELVIEERSADEVWWGERVEGVAVGNPAFDVTPPGLISSIVSEGGAVPPAEAAEGARRMLELDTYGVFRKDWGGRKPAEENREE